MVNSSAVSLFYKNYPKKGTIQNFLNERMSSKIPFLKKDIQSDKSVSKNSEFFF